MRLNIGKLTKHLLLGALSSILIMGTVLNPVYADDDLSDRTGLAELPAPVLLTEDNYDSADVYDFNEDGYDDSPSPIYANGDYQYWSQYTNQYYYNQLSEKHQMIWDIFYNLSMNVFSSSETASMTEIYTFDINQKITFEDLLKVRKFFYYANPQFYFLDGAFGYSTDTNTGYVDRVALCIAEDFQDGAKRQSATATFRAKLDEWVAEVKNGAYDADKVKLAHDIVAKNTIYNLDSEDNQSAYSMVVNGATVCSGYASTFEMLLNAAGVETIEVTSLTHAWNMVNLHGFWYIVDVTWDDSTDQRTPVKYNYYNKSLTTVLSKDQDAAHEMWDWYEGYVPEANYDSCSIDFAYQYTSPYFTEGGYTYFKVNDNSYITERTVLAVGGGSLEFVPTSVTYSGIVYKVSNPGSNPGGSASSNNAATSASKNNAAASASTNNTATSASSNNTATSASSNNTAASASSNNTATSASSNNTAASAGTNNNSSSNADNGASSDSSNASESSNTAAVEDTSSLNLSWNSSGLYWYEGGVRQGTYDDPYGVIGDGSVRGREIYDPKSDGWYWLDACYDGAKAVSKEVWMPYVYGGEDNWDEAEKWANANASGTMATQVKAAMDNKSGKWVRYDAKGAMVKGWYTVKGADALIYPSQAGNTYYYDYMTGLMAKGETVIDGITYYFDPISGALQ